MENIYLTKNEIAMHSMEDALELVKLLVNNGYVTAVSVEEQVVIVNYVWTPRYADRNEVVFQGRYNIEDELDSTYEQGYRDGKEDTIQAVKESQGLD